MMTTMLGQQVEERGHAIVPNCIGEQSLRALEPHLNGGQSGLRNLLGLPAVSELACSEPIRQLVEPVLGPDSFAVRGILLNKLPGANWKAVWHQDCVIAVRKRKDLPGWGPWSVKHARYYWLLLIDWPLRPA